MSAPGPGLQAIVFDVDGTLAETERHGHRVAYNQAFAELGADWSWDESLYGDLLRVEGGLERLQYYFGDRRPDLVAADEGEQFIDNAYARKNRRYRELLEAGRMPLRPGVRRLIAEARSAGLRLAIASSSQRGNVAALLHNALAPEAEHWFEAIVTGDDVDSKKPSPEIYERVLERLALPPGACIAIEDSANGCRAAVTAGLPTLVTTSSYTTDHNFDGAILVTDSLGDPDHPVHVLQGSQSLEGAEVIDVAVLRRLHRRATGPAE